MYPVAAIATYYSGLLRPSPEAARRGMAARGGTTSINAGMMAKLVAEVSSRTSKRQRKGAKKLILVLSCDAHSLIVH